MFCSCLCRHLRISLFEAKNGCSSVAPHAVKGTPERRSEEVFLDYLRLRFEFEPLPHYVMAAMHVCDETSRDYPPFVRAFMTWFAESFLFDRKGTFPAESHNTDPADYRWRRFQDCHDPLEGWHSDDLKGALEAREERWELVKRVAELRLEERDDPIGKADRQRQSTTKTDAEVFDDLEDWFGERAYTHRRNHTKLTKHAENMTSTFPVALVRSGDGYEIRTLQIAPEGAINIEHRQSR